MRLTIGRDPLLAALARVQSAVLRRSTIPVLGGVLIQAVGNMVSVRATDLDMWATATLEADAAGEDGVALMALDPLSDILRSFPAGADVLIAQDGARFALSHGKACVRIPGVDAADFPVVPDAEFEVAGAMPSSKFRWLLERTRYAVSKEATRFYISGVRLHTHAVDGRRVLRAVATDGKLLSLADADLSAGVEMASSIPPRAVDAILKLAPDSAAEAVLSARQGMFRVEVGGDTFVTKTIDYEFPDYQRVIPQENRRLVTVDREPLTRALRRIMVVAGDERRTFNLAVDEGRLDLLVRNFSAGEAADEVEATSDGPSMTLTFSAVELLSCLDECGGEALEIAFGDPSTPIIIRRVEQVDTFSLVLPRAA